MVNNIWWDRFNNSVGKINQFYNILEHSRIDIKIAGPGKKKYIKMDVNVYNDRMIIEDCT